MKQICLNNRMGREKFPCHKFFCVSVWCYGVSQNTIFYENLYNHLCMDVRWRREI